MSDTGPYGVTEHADEAMVTANQLVGDRVGLTIGDAVTPGVSPAWHSTAPYVKPKVKPDHPGKLGCYGKDGTCAAPAMRNSDYCVYHSPDYGRERREPRTTA